MGPESSTGIVRAPLAGVVLPARDGGGHVRARDSDAFDDFVRGRLPSLLRLGRALTGSDRAGEQLVQDALERTLIQWSRIETEDPEGHVRRVMVARHLSRWHRVRRARQPGTLGEQAYVERSAERAGRPVDDPANERATDPAGDLARDGGDRVVRAALDRLPARQRTVLVLRCYDDLTDAQTADALEVSVGTVRSLANRALGRLGTLLGEGSGADERSVVARSDAAPSGAAPSDVGRSV